MNSLPSLPDKGPLNAAAFGIVPYTPAVPRTRLLVLACGVKIHFPWVLACERNAAAIATVRKAVAGLPIDIVPFPEPFEDPTALLAALDTELPKGIAGIVFFHAAYTAGEIGSHFGRWLIDHPVPVLSWSHPDPASERNTANSFCCQNFILGMWSRLGVRYAWMHAPIDESAVPELETFARTSRTRDRLRHARILHVGGSRVSAFYDGEADELALMRRFGVRFDRIDIETAFQFSKRRFSESQVTGLREALKALPQCSLVDLPDSQIDQTYRFGLAMLEMAREGGYAGATFKSWPDLFDCYGCAIDGAVSLCNDMGFTVAEEGEMPGALTSLILNLLSEGAAVANLQDMSSVSTSRNTIGTWHCGAAPLRWLRAGTRFAARRHSILENGDPTTAVGLMVEFLLSTGPVTVARYQSPDAVRCIAFEGEIIDSPMPFRGTWGEMRANRGPDAAAIAGAILAGGLDHHWSLGFGHWGAALRQLNHWLGVHDIPIPAVGAALHGVGPVSQ
ncbi:MAG: fucose isomerase [Opitutaceae bacterium]|nr:fucose isomerase [Opitutaceae bacterium]